MKRIKLIVAYDGGAYCGWQIQKNGITIEEVLNEALSRLLSEEIHVIGASRTDAGVHALGNVAVFDTETRIPGEKIAYALNQRLPEDIRIQGSQEVEADFHPRYQNSVKTYEYRIYNGPFEMPLYRSNTYFFHRKLDVEKMRAAARYLEGEQDFAAFCSAHAQVRETTRTIYSAKIVTEEPVPEGEGKKRGVLIRFRISGNGFLYNMVRIITGTLIEVGLGKYPPERIREIIEDKDREKAGPCAPAKGLTLVGIEYEQTLADELHVINERMHYSFVQKEIKSKQEACLIIFRCQEELLGDLIVRMTKKAFRLGAKRFYVQNREDSMLSQALGHSRHNDCKEQDYFTAGDFRYVLDHQIWQMDRDLRADPPEKTEAEERLQLKPLTKTETAEFCRLYNKCFFAQPCVMLLTEERLELMADPAGEEEEKEKEEQKGTEEQKETEEQRGTEEQKGTGEKRESGPLVLSGNDQAYLVYDRAQAHQAAGLLILSQAVHDPDALQISAVGIDGCFRKKGYGGMLLEWTAQKAMEEGKKRVSLEVSSRNKRAISLYQKAGFYRIKREEKCWYRADRGKNPQKTEKTGKK